MALRRYHGRRGHLVFGGICLAMMAAAWSCGKGSQDSIKGIERPAILTLAGSRTIPADWSTHQDLVRGTSQPLETGNHGKRISLWYSRSLLEMIESREAFEAPSRGEDVRAILQTRDEENREVLLGMLKVRDSDPANRDWYFETLRDRQVVREESGHPRACVDCHSKYSKTDFLAYPSILAKLDAPLSPSPDPSVSPSPSPSAEVDIPDGPGKFDLQYRTKGFVRLSDAKEATDPAQNPHGKGSIWVSSNDAKILERTAKPLRIAQGTVLVLEVENSTAADNKIFVMIRRSHDSTEPWAFEYRDGFGTVRPADTGPACATCHPTRAVACDGIVSHPLCQ